ncbi:dolichol kinase [Luteibacter sp. Sphag1AF]|uniref:hypothetical protein n=1 Tax=Luteibacter sp. Sphag1AF TaxID=2587031 RepID=UPI001621A01A|nr:hypothetical protein [Luteibacter sp. Sphag1AF]MBB3228882.1 dolichol kinase [Luteibacter sp. Sphag1AF]
MKRESNAIMQLTPSLMDNIQWLRVALYLVVGPLAIGRICTYLKFRHAWTRDYTRKINHIGIMVVTAPILAVLPDAQLLPSVLAASLIQVTMYVFAANSERPMIHAFAAHSLRDSDAPRARLFFLLPMISFNVALAGAVLVYPMTAVKVAFFAVALGDGLAEPAGFLLGKGNRFQVTDRVWGGSNTKSVAGCLTVFVFSAAVAMVLLGVQRGMSPALVAVSLAYGAIATALEALSPRGLDNMILVLVSPMALLALMLFL